MSDSDCSNLPLPPGDMGWPIIGQTLKFAQNADDFLASLPKEPVIKLNLFGETTVFVNDREAAHKIATGEGKLVTADHAGMPTARMILGCRNMGQTTPKEHDALRRAMNPLLNQESIEENATKLHDILRKSLDEWESEGVLDANLWCRKVAYSFGCTFCGLYDAVDNEDLCSQGEFFMKALMCLPIPMKLPFCDSDYPKGVEARLDLLETIDEHLKKREADMAAGKEPPKDMMQVLIDTLSKDGVPLAENADIRDNLVGMFVGSFDTTAQIFNRFMHQMCLHPDIQAKAREQIRDVLGDDRSTITREQLRECTYVKQINKESMRHNVNGFSPFRHAIKDFEVAGFRIKKGWRVLLRTRELAFNEEVFKDAEKFDPDRFSPERGEGKAKGTFYPYGYGSRRCFGERLAELEREMLAVMILRDYEVSFAGDEPKWGPMSPISHIIGEFDVKLTKV